MAAPSIFKGIVKQVNSGDTIVIQSAHDRKNERVLHLVCVSSPRLKRGEDDEPFAYESRELLRKSLLAQEVQFKILYSINSQDYGVVMTRDRKNFPYECLTAGTLKLRLDAAKRMSDTDEQKTIFEALERAEQAAKDEHRGVWNRTTVQPKLSWEVGDKQAFVEKWKDQPIEGLVEKIISGDRLVVRLILDASHHLQTSVILAGIRAPSTKRTLPDGKTQPAEPYGEEAKDFMETRLLQRVLQVQVVGASPHGLLVVKIIHPKQGNVAEHLLKEGLAQCTDHHSTLLGPEMATLRECEKLAKEQKRNLFKDHVASAVRGKEAQVIISKIHSAETLYARSRNGQERRIGLSSLRGPKLADAAQAPFVAEAKEFVRKMAIGKHAALIIDGKKAARENYEEHDVGTLMIGGKNLAIQIVSAGYASVVRHRKDDTDRSPFYDDLLAAEAAAMAAKHGMWASKPPAAKEVIDYSANVQKAKVQASVLQRQKRIPAIVDFVKSASRLVLIVPRESAKLTLVLAGVRAPKTARNASETSEPFGQEAYDFAQRKILQRDVEIDIEGVDEKSGALIGTLFINHDNYAKLLVDEGLATVHRYSAEKSPHGAELIRAEQAAQEKRINMWKDYQAQPAAAAVESVPTENGQSSATGPSMDYREVYCTFISPATLALNFNQVKGIEKATPVLDSLKKWHALPSNAKPLAEPPKTGQHVSAKFSADGEWYRAKVRRNDRETKSSEVHFIDYGNEEKVSWKDLRPLADDFGISATKPQALVLGLSCIQFPSNDGYNEEICNFLMPLLLDRRLVARVDATDASGSCYATLYDGADREEPDSINALLVASGWAMVNRKQRPHERNMKSTISSLQKREEEAKKAHLGIWEYGDISEDD